VTSYGLLAHPGLHYDSQINAELLRTRLWYAALTDGSSSKDEQQRVDQQLVEHLRLVAAAAKNLPLGLLDAMHRRRQAAARALAERERGCSVLSLLITPQWRIVVGHGENSPHETSLSFSATYGMPIWPASGLKGVAAAHGRATAIPDDELGRLFGTPRPGAAASVPAHQGAVTVLDALPAQPPSIVVDVLTPHVKPYYDEAIRDPHKITHPPAEYHNPVPVRFLAVGATPFRTLIIGRPSDARRFVQLLQQAADDLGLGGKTAAGYGYCTVEIENEHFGWPE
jgi:CRISPR/Cas system CMR subunit Cmr6 (Cas7 group RAMP superfamily)